MDAPVAPLVGVGQGGAGDTSANAHAVELALLGAQTGFDVAQALAIGQLCEGHAQVLIETGKALDFVVAAIALDATAEGVKGKVIEHLGGVCPIVCVSVSMGIFFSASAR